MPRESATGIWSTGVEGEAGRRIGTAARGIWDGGARAEIGVEEKPGRG